MTLCNGLLEQLRLAREEETVISGSFSGEALHGGDLTKLDFRNVVLSGCHFTDCGFSQASFVDVRLEQCSFAGFFHTFWRRCALSCCKGDGANFCGSSLRETQILECALRYANFSDGSWERCTVRDSVLREAALSAIRLLRVAFSGTDLSGVDFFKTILKGVDLSGCDISGILVSENCAELRGAAISAAQSIELARILGVRIVG